MAGDDGEQERQLRLMYAGKKTKHAQDLPEGNKCVLDVHRETLRLRHPCSVSVPAILRCRQHLAKIQVTEKGHV